MLSHIGGQRGAISRVRKSRFLRRDTQGCNFRRPSTCSTPPLLVVPHWLNDSNWEWRDTDITEAQQELRRLIAKWNRSGPNLLKLFKENPDLQASCTEGTTMLIPNTDGVAQLAWFPRAVGHKNVAKGCCPFSLHPVPGEFPCADTRRSPVGVVASSMSRTPNARKQIARVGAEPPVRL